MTRRGKLRLWLLLGFIPFAIAGIWFGVKLMSLQTITGGAIEAFDQGDYTSSQTQIDPLVGDSLVESWIPYFDRGDARVGSNDVTSAIDDFEKALQLAPDDKKCMVGLNLASGWETLGDSYFQAGSYDGALQLYANAQKVLDGLGSDCAKSGQQDQLQAKQQEIQIKEQLAQQGAQAQDGSSSDSGSKLDQLGQKQDQSDQDKQNSETRGRTPSSPGSTSKPW